MVANQANEDANYMEDEPMSASIADVSAYWDAYPCNSAYSTHVDRREYFEEIERTRFASEPHIRIIGRFDQFQGRSVLEVGCGIGTDGFQFAKNGARYTGIDLTPAAIRISAERFRLFDVEGEFQEVNAENMPLATNSFDHVYSCGVIHHSPNTEAIVHEIHRVLKPGGTFTVMVYNRTSINYYIEIMILRKLFRRMLYPSFMPALLARLLGVDEGKLRGHREWLLRKPKMSEEEWLSINTDGPHNPLSKVYSAAEVRRLFHGFEDVRTEVWHFNRSHWPVIGTLITDRIARFLGRHWGWHRIVYGRKPE
jgi:ubiquinone/menaquinone biosynthesis C-methylase UbiE